MTPNLQRHIPELGIPYQANDNIAGTILSPDDLALMEANVTTICGQLLEALCIDQDDPNTRDTPARMAKMYVHEVCRGRFEHPPKITTFPNTDGLDEIITTGPITVRSMCSHHFCPIIGKCWIGVVPGELLAGLSKFNRIVDWFARRPQMQEELTIQIADYIEQQLQPAGVAVIMEASHTCLIWRGVEESTDTVMTNSVMRGIFRERPEARAELMALLKR